MLCEFWYPPILYIKSNVRLGKLNNMSNLSYIFYSYAKEKTDLTLFQHKIDASILSSGIHVLLEVINCALSEKVRSHATEVA